VTQIKLRFIKGHLYEYNEIKEADSQGGLKIPTQPAPADHLKIRGSK